MEVQSCFRFVCPDLPEHSSFSQYLCTQFQQYQNAIALVNSDTGESWKFSELKNWIKQARSSLEHIFGVDADSRVAFAALNCPQVILLQLACASLGVPCIALNARGTIDEVLHQVSVSDATHVFTEPDFESKINDVREKAQSANSTSPSRFNLVALLKDVVTKPSNPVSEEVKLRGSLSSTHIIYFSSGTTGLPKAVEITHKSMAINFHQMNAIHLKTKTGNKQESFLAQLPFHHLYGTNIAFWCLYSGTKCVTMSKFVPDTYLKALQDYQISILHTVPPIVRMLATNPAVESVNLSSLKSVASCGAPLDRETAEACVQRLKLLDLRQLYGMTEVLTVCWSASGDTNYSSTGKLVPGLSCRIVDPETRRLVGPGEEGEMCVKGPAINPTYYNNQEASLGLYDSDGYIKTGDLGYYDKDGYIYIVDRLKDLMKYKGTQISPSEIEKILQTLPGVGDCVVVGKKDKEAGDLPTGFIVQDPVHPNLTEDDVHKHLKGKVSSYKELKGGVFFVDAIPKSPSGKVLKRILISKV